MFFYILGKFFLIIKNVLTYICLYDIFLTYGGDTMKINKTYGNRHKINTNFKQTNEGVRGMIRSIDKDYNHTFVELDGTYGYEREKVLDRARVQLEERRVFEKVLRNKKV